MLVCSFSLNSFSYSRACESVRFKKMFFIKRENVKNIISVIKRTGILLYRMNLNKGENKNS